MRRRNGALALALVATLAGPAGAKDHKKKPTEVAKAPDAAPRPVPDAHAALADQLAAETTALAKTRATVTDKLALADAARLHRLRAAARILHAPLANDATDDDRLAYARRRAAVRLLVDRDAAERDLLANEAAHLRTSATELATATAQLERLALPEDLGWPAHGTVLHHVGPYEHEASRAQLSRRGIDVEVDEHAPALAPEAGVVRYVGEIRGLDSGVILDHGDYLTIIARLSDPAIPLGAHVARGDRLGRAAHHRVYLELRAKLGPGGLPVDPEPYLKR